MASKNSNTDAEQVSVKGGRGSKAVRIVVGALLIACMVGAVAAHNTLLKPKDVSIPVTSESDAAQSDYSSEQESSSVSSAETDSGKAPDTSSVKSESSKASSSKAASSKAASSKAASSKASSSKAASSKAASSKSTAGTVTIHNNGTQGGSGGTSSKSSSSASSASTPAPAPEEPIIIPEVHDSERFDENGRLIADTDTLDGKKAIAITFDDGPSKFTSKLIDGLNARGARATFFMVGSCVERYPDLLPRMVEGGHQLGNHTYNHPRMTDLSEWSWRNEIDVTDNAIHNACGQYATAFRPPYGSYSQYMSRSIDKTFVVWSVDTLDWKTRNTNSVYNEMMNNCRDGSIVLLHDLYETSVDAALMAITDLQAQGYVFVTVDELLTRYGYPIANTAHFSQYPVESVVFVEKEEPTTDSEPEQPQTTDSDTPPDTDVHTDSETDTSSESGETSSETETYPEEQESDVPEESSPSSE